MISRLTTLATAFAVLATASLAYAASAQHTLPINDSASVTPAKQVRIVQLERVVITAKRLPAQAI